MQGQVAWFLHAQPGEKVLPAIERYTNETKRLYSVLDARLRGREFVVSDHFTYIDAAFFPWVFFSCNFILLFILSLFVLLFYTYRVGKVRGAGYANFDIETTIKNDYPNVYSWFRRPSVVAVYQDVPHPAPKN
jgi:glutathione S-transferase